MSIYIHLQQVDNIDGQPYLSEKYTISEKKGLQLYYMDYKYIGNDWSQVDIDDAEWQSNEGSKWKRIFFFAPKNNDEVIALNFFINNLNNYLKCNLNENKEDYFSKNLILWVDLINPQLLKNKYTIEESQLIINNIIFKQRKMANLISVLKNNYGMLDDLLNNNYIIANRKSPPL